MPRRRLEIVEEASAAHSGSSVRRPDELDESRWFTWKKKHFASSAFSLVGQRDSGMIVILHRDNVEQRGSFLAAAQRD